MDPKVKADYAVLCAAPAGAAPAWFRERGYAFERLLADLLREDNLEPRTGYKPSGEQIDGSFFLDGKVFLLEAKWHRHEIPASALYQFKGKVDGKLAGTIGVYISMSGYSNDAVDALTVGKSLNLLLFDKQDVDFAINEGLGFRAVLKLKLRKAAEEGVVYFPMTVEHVTSKKSSFVGIGDIGGPQSADTEVAPEERPASADLIIVCEGGSDRELLGYLAQRILAATKSEKTTNIVAANGKLSVPRLANAMHSLAPGKRLVVVVDSDGDVANSRHMLEQNLEFPGWDAVIPEPEIESWVGLDRQSLPRSGREKAVSILNAAKAVDIDSLRKTDSAFAKFYEVVSRA